MNPPIVSSVAEGNVTVSATTDGADWDRFVRAHPESTGYHLWNWRRIFESAFSHRTEYLAARRDSAIVGVLPLVVLRSRLFGRFMVSLPFVNYGGILADSDETHRALLARAHDVARDAGLSHIELRHRRRMFSDLPVKEHKVAMLLHLPRESDRAWRGLQSNVRNHVRKAQKRDLHIRVGGRELVNDFYGVFARNMRDLGTPVYSRNLFDMIVEQFPVETRIFTVSTADRTVAAAFTYSYRDAVEVPWSASLREYRDLSANNLMYWTMIENAIDHGYNIFDFGRSSPGDGPFQFKRQWGAAPEPLYWEYALLESDTLPDHSPKNPKFRFAINAWKHMPVGLANLVGPRLVRSIP